MVSVTTKGAEPPTDRLKQAEELEKAKQLEHAINLYKSVLSEQSTNEDILREQEFALIRLGELYKDLGYRISKMEQ